MQNLHFTTAFSACNSKIFSWTFKAFQLNWKRRQKIKGVLWVETIIAFKSLNGASFYELRCERSHLHVTRDMFLIITSRCPLSQNDILEELYKRNWKIKSADYTLLTNLIKISKQFKLYQSRSLMNFNYWVSLSFTSNEQSLKLRFCNSMQNYSIYALILSLYV